MEYITYRGSQIAEVRCKGSCATILVADERPTAAYCELVLAMRNGDGQLSKHETAMCKPCKARIVHDGPQLGELEAIYAQDIEQWMGSAQRDGTSASEIARLVYPMLQRAPIRALDEPGRGEAA